MSEEKKLSAEDMARVEAYLNSGFNQTERKPFRGLILLGWYLGDYCCSGLDQLSNW
jgi:hypothetical protein